jgi:hypothetical protein
VIVVADVVPEGAGPQAVRTRTTTAASLDRKDAMLAIHPRSLAGRIGAEAVDEFGP